MSERPSGILHPPARGPRPGRAWRGVVPALAGLLLGAFILRQAADAASGPRYDGVPVAGWLRRAMSGDFRERLAAEPVLARFGPEAIPALIRAVETRDPVWWPHWQALRRKVFPGSPPAVSREQLNRCAAGRLAQFGPAASNAVPALLRWGVRGTDPADVRRVVAAIGPASVPGLLEGLQARDPRVRLVAARASGQAALQPAADLLRPALLRLLGESDPTVRLAAARALAELCPSDSAVAERVAAWMPETDPAQAVELLATLARFGTAAAGLADRVRPYLTAREPSLQVTAARCLYAIQPPAREVIPVLVELLRAALPGGRAAPFQWEIVRALGDMGPDANEAIPDLLSLLESAPTHRPTLTPHFAVYALGRMGPAAVPGLSRLLEHPSRDTRINAAAALAELGELAAPAVPRLLPMLSSELPEEQWAAARTLGVVGAAAAPARPALERLAQLETTQEVIIGHLRSAARSALAELQRAVEREASSPPAL